MFKAVITTSSEENSPADGASHSPKAEQPKQPALSLPQQSGQLLIPLPPPVQQEIPLQHPPLPLLNTPFPLPFHSPLSYPSLQNAPLPHTSFAQSIQPPPYFFETTYARSFLTSLISEQQQLRKEQFLQLQDSAEPLVHRWPEAVQRPLLKQAEPVCSYRLENSKALLSWSPTLAARELEVFKYERPGGAIKFGAAPWGNLPLLKMESDFKVDMGQGLLIDGYEYTDGLVSKIHIDVAGHQNDSGFGVDEALRIVSEDIAFIKTVLSTSFTAGVLPMCNIYYEREHYGLIYPSREDIQPVKSYSVEFVGFIGRSTPLPPDVFEEKVVRQIMFRLEGELRALEQEGGVKKESLEKLLKNLFASATGDKYFLEEQPALTVEHLDDEASVNAYIPDEKSDSSTSENHLPVESNEEGKDLLMGVVDQIDQSGL